MKFHRVLLFTSIQMDITPVGEDLLVVLTTEGQPFIGCTSYSWMDPESGKCDSSVLATVEDPEPLMCSYVSESICKKTGKNVLCTGGIFVENPDENQVRKLYENVDEMIMDWVNFLND